MGGSYFLMEQHRVEHILVRWVGVALALLGVVVLALTPFLPGFLTLRLAAPLLAIGLLLYLFGTHGGKPVR